MDEQPAGVTLNPLTITFDNGNQAKILQCPLGTNPQAVLDALGIQPPQRLIVIAGGATDFEETLESRLMQLFSRGIARAAIDKSALIIDGGTQRGVMAIIGQGVADRGNQSVLIGVAPLHLVTFPGAPLESHAEVVPLDPNHRHFVLADSNSWDDTTKMMDALAAQVVAQGPAVIVLTNGGMVAKAEVLCGVRRGWPLVIVEGSGGLADEIVTLVDQKPGLIIDPALAEIIAEGKLYVFKQGGSPDALRKLITRLLDIDMTLRLAWEQFGRFDKQAGRQRKAFERLQAWVLRLGVFTTFMVLLKSWPETTKWLSTLEPSVKAALELALYVVILALPITTSVLLAITSRFNAGSKWVLFRTSAEEIKGAIFTYRTRPVTRHTPYRPVHDNDQSGSVASSDQTDQLTREAILADQVQFISSQLIQTNVNLSNIPPYTEPIPPQGAAADGDDGLSFLTPDQYLAARLEHQLNFYLSRTEKLYRELRRYQIAVLISGAVGTFLAAVGFDLWVAFTTALATAFASWLQSRQVENTLVQYNQTIINLQNIKSWWMALSADAQTDPSSVDKLVEHTERILGAENRGWVQQMQDTLAGLRKDRQAEADRGQSQPGEAAQSA